MDNGTMPGSSVIKNTPLGLTLEIPLLYTLHQSVTYRLGETYLKATAMYDSSS